MPTSILAGFFSTDNNSPTAILYTSSTIYKLIYMVGVFLVDNCGSDGLPFKLLSFVYLFVSRSSYLVERISVCMDVLERPKMVNVLGSSPCNTYVLCIDINCNN
jgi:hypothetical protein